jgi:ornithine carbamoyltransferase
MPSIRPTMASSTLRSLSRTPVRSYSNPATKAPRHLMTIADLTPNEFTTLVRNAASHKKAIKAGSIPQNLNGALTGKTVAMTFSKRSTRTRISTEGMIKITPF